MATGTIMPPSAGDDRQRQALAVAQLAEVELALGLQADDEEEERHEPSLTHSRRSAVSAQSPSRIDSSVVHTDS